LNGWRELSGVVVERARSGCGDDVVRRGAGATVRKALSGPGADGDVGRFMGWRA